MREALQVVRGLWGDGPFSFSGQHFTIAEMEGWPSRCRSPARRS